MLYFLLLKTVVPVKWISNRDACPTVIRLYKKYNSLIVEDIGNLRTQQIQAERVRKL